MRLADILKDSTHRIEFYNRLAGRSKLEAIRSCSNPNRIPMFAVVSNLPEIVGFPLHPYDPWFGQIIGCSPSINYLNKFLFWLSASTINSKFGIDHKFKYLDDHYPEFRILTLKDVYALLASFDKNSKYQVFDAVWHGVIDIFSRCLLHPKNSMVTEPVKPIMEKFSGEAMITQEEAEKFWLEVAPIKKTLEPYHYFNLQSEKDYADYHWGLTPKELSYIHIAMSELETKFGLEDEKKLLETFEPLVKEKPQHHKRFDLSRLNPEYEEMYNDTFDFDFDYEVDVFDSDYEDGI